MPIFQDDIGRQRSTPATKSPFTFLSPPGEEPAGRRQSEESIRTDLCEGPLLDPPNESYSSRITDLESSDIEETMGLISGRQELIERLKRQQSPTWMPTRHFENLVHDLDGLPRGTTTPKGDPPILMAPAEIRETQRGESTSDLDTMQVGLSIERPRSALHSGDFTQERPQERRDISNDIRDRQISYIASQSPWLSTSPPRHFTPYQRETRSSPSFGSVFDQPNRSRAPSLSSSYSSSFVLKPPTSPLVQSESNDEADLTVDTNGIDIDRNKKSSRRHTLQISHSFHSSPSIPSAHDRSLPYLRRDPSFPYQAHQPRRSVTGSHSLSNPGSSPQTPSLLRSRRPSYTSDSSPLQHASMVGSYEESILRGRMSTTPSRPLDFVAEIGVLGLGKCKSSLRCPPHVTLPFPAVFYSYGSTPHGRGVKAEDGPSPYVGQIDLENGLPHLNESHHERRKRRDLTPVRGESGDVDMPDVPESTERPSERDIRKVQKQRRRSRSPKAPPGGSYRIPEKGQIQIIIKNPNKTAVKLFLVPYDLAGMEPGTKTFIRQRIYSAGPIIDTPLTSSLHTPSSDPPKERGTLRYLVHLQICSPSRGRFFLYKSIRVVFANRVPDGKEKLQNEIHMPQPRFSAYKPARELSHSHSSLSAASIAAEKAFRRRSSGFPSAVSHVMLDAMDGVIQSLQGSMSGGSPYPDISQSSTTPVEPIPFSLFKQKAVIIDSDAPAPSLTSSKSSRPTTSQDSALSGSWNSEGEGVGAYDKLNKGDIGYGGNAFAGLHNGQQTASEGLLAMKLRGLGVGKPKQDPSVE